MKKKISFLSLLLASFLIVMALASCKDQNQGGGATPEFNVRKLSLWGKNILSKKDGDKVELSGSDNPKILQVTETMVKDYTVSVIVDDEEPITKATKTGIVKLDLKKLPETEKGMLIKLSANGVKEWSKSILVQMVRGVAGDLQTAFVKGEDNVERFIPKGEKPIFSTSKDKGKITLKTSSSEMSKVIVDGNDVTATALAADKKSATYELPITVTVGQKQAVKVEVEFEYYLKATAEFEVEKYANPSDFPLRVLGASITTVKPYPLNFDAQNKASIELNDIKFSTVQLDMKFDIKLEKREVIECIDQRQADYGTKLTNESLLGIFSGYVVAEFDITKPGFPETKLNQISKDKYKYAEYLIVGYGTVTYKIKITAENGKDVTYTIEIKNTYPVDKIPELKDDAFNALLTIFNGNSGRPIVHRASRTINLPFYAKGPIFKNKELSSDGIIDLAYMDHLAMTFIVPKINDELQAFYVYHNVFADEGGTAKNKHEFKRMLSGVPQSQDKSMVFLDVDDLDGKYLDMFIATEKYVPYPMIPFYYGKKWRRMTPKHGFLLGLINQQKVAWPGVAKDQLPASFGFDAIYNYRVQSVIADNLNKSPSVEPKELTVIKNLKSFQYWETAQDIEPLRTKYLVGKTATDKDIFTFAPIFPKSSEIVKSVKYTIKKKKADTDDYDADATFKDYEAVNTDNGYIIGGKTEADPKDPNKKLVRPAYDFEDGNIYKVEVEVEYNEGNKKDKFHYLLDYKSTDKTVDIMDIADDMDMGGNLFGVPTSYGVKTIDPAILQDIATTRYTSFQDMSSYVK